MDEIALAEVKPMSEQEFINNIEKTVTEMKVIVDEYRTAQMQILECRSRHTKFHSSDDTELIEEDNL